MPKHTSPLQRAQIIYLFNEGHSYRQIAKRLKIKYDTAKRWADKKGEFEETGELKRKKGQGRKPKYTKQQAKRLEKKLEANGMTQKKLAKCENTSRVTIRKYTRRNKNNPNGSHPYIPGKKSKYTPLQQTKRLNYAHFMVLGCVGYDGKANLYVHATKRDKKRGEGKMWEHETVNGETFLQAIKSSVIPFCEDQEIDFLLSDGVKCGRTKGIFDEFSDNGMTLYPSATKTKNGFPPNSHDCNPLETIFARWKEKIYLRFKPDGTTERTMDNLHKIMIEEWEHMDQEEIRKIIDLQPIVMKEIIAKGGLGTKY